ncbi:uncharacterized protein TNCT_284171 [Trichonephila clavata]|uniref:Uncharacterized protein n=1 Tax=Trichonephila clavata TaxID=2740835 RepID=A0A8X6J8P8_TRICU|nr:uncharacterized protein TNCT_284171 [Trichonephila clavata]
MEAKHVNAFRPHDIMWEKVSKSLLKNPDGLLKNTDKRMVYMYGNMCFVKKDLTFGLRTVHPEEVHFIQTTQVPILLYELPPSSLQCRAQPNVARRSFEPYGQMLYHRTILEPHTAYPIPDGTHYLMLTVQKTAFGLDIIPESLLPQLFQKGFYLGDFRKMKRFEQTPYKLPPPTPAHGLKRPLKETHPPKKRGRIMRLVQIPEPIEIPEPVQIPEPIQIPVPVHIPEPQLLYPEPELLYPQPVQIPETELLYPEPVQIPDLEQIPEPMQIPEPDTALLDQLLSSVYEQEPQAFQSRSNGERQKCIRLMESGDERRVKKSLGDRMERKLEPGSRDDP